MYGFVSSFIFETFWWFIKSVSKYSFLFFFFSKKGFQNKYKFLLNINLLYCIVYYIRYPQLQVISAYFACNINLLPRLVVWIIYIPCPNLGSAVKILIGMEMWVGGFSQSSETGFSASPRAGVLIFWFDDFPLKIKRNNLQYKNLKNVQSFFAFVIVVFQFNKMRG